MRHRLVTTSNAGICALFDRSLTVEAARHWWHDYAEWLNVAAGQGDLFRYEMGGAGDCALDCFVTDDPPEDLRPHLYQPTEELLLRVPTGQLCFAGAEYIPTEDHEAWEFVAIPEGDYALRAWLVDPDIERPEPPRHGQGPPIGCLLFLLFLPLTVAFAIWPTLYFAAIILAAVIMAVTVGLLYYDLSGRREKKQQEYARALRKGPPNIVVSLHRAEDTGGMVGGGISV